MSNERMQVSIVVPALDETYSLQQTVDTVIADNAHALGEVLIVLGVRTTQKTRAIATKLHHAHPALVRIVEQRRPRLGGALRDGFEAAQGSHVLMMAADLETPPALVSSLIAAARQGTDIVTATRWAQGGSLTRKYGRVKRLLNYGFQRTFRRLYGTELTDLTYGFRLMRIRWVKDIAFEETGHALMLETLIKPLRLGASVKEIPCSWQPRMEGVSSNSYKQMFDYVPLILRTRLRAPAKLWRADMTDVRA